MGTEENNTEENNTEENRTEERREGGRREGVTDRLHYQEEGSYLLIRHNWR